MATDTGIGQAPSASGDPRVMSPRRARGRRLSPLSRALWALTALAAVVLAVGAVGSRTLAVSGALLLAGSTTALLLEGVARGWEIEEAGAEARRRVGVRAALRIGAALVVVSVACASAVIGWSGLAVASAAILCLFAIFGGPAWLASVAEAEEDARVRSRDARR
ncbi:MAG: hypothetical protein GC172_03900 [Phycisphaera sp.]|nr:hypothetical protein [Phycisphaera sp.]